MMLNVATKNGLKRVKVEKITKILGIKCFIHRDIDFRKRWVVSEYSTGGAFCNGESINAVIKSARLMIGKRGIEATESAIADFIKEHNTANIEKQAKGARKG